MSDHYYKENHYSFETKCIFDFLLVKNSDNNEGTYNTHVLNII